MRLTGSSVSLCKDRVETVDLMAKLSVATSEDTQLPQKTHWPCSRQSDRS